MRIEEYLEFKFGFGLFLLNRKYPNINYGGCGVFAYHFGECYRKKYPLSKVEYVYIESENPPAGRPEYDIWFNHILVKIENMVIDNNGFHSIDRIKCDLHPLNNDKLLEMINIKELWNHIYDHTYTPCLVNDIKNLFTIP
jgi:hypothetical protein